MNYSHEHWLTRAAELLEEVAAELHQSHTVDGVWDDDDPGVEEHYDEMRQAANAVREAAVSAQGEKHG